jgi:protein SCO1/2
MNAVRNVCRFLLIGFMLAPAAYAAGPEELPGESVYRLDIPLVGQDGRRFQLADRRGRAQVISMFYSSCPYVCPLTIDTLRKTQKALAPPEQKKLDVLLVSFDPERDTPARLKQVADERKLDSSNWTLASTDAASVRKLAAILDIQYRILAGGDINHSTSLVLLDASGRIVMHTEKMGETDPAFVAAINRTLGAK